MIFRGLERRAETFNPSHPRDALLAELFGVQPTAAGVRVDLNSAVSLSAVYGAARVLAETVASVPWILYRRLKPRGKERATEHPLYRLLHSAPNPEMTSAVFRETFMYNAALAGNGLAEIQRNGRNEPIALWPLLADRTSLVRSPKGELVYFVRVPNGELRSLPRENVFHVPGIGSNGLWGKSIVHLGRESLGASLAAQEFSGRFFANGATVGGVLQHPGKLSPEAQLRLKQAFDQAQAGLTNSHRTLVAEEGMEWKQVGIAPENAQLLETRKFNVRDVARWFRMQPHLIQDLEDATFTNIEHQSLEFVKYTMLPWFTKIEQETGERLLAADEQEELLAEFLLNALLRGDYQTRTTGYSTLLQSGVLSPNEVRELENLNPRAGGDRYMRPLAMVEIDEKGNAVDPFARGADTDDGADPKDEEEEDDDPETAPAKRREQRARRSAALRGRLEASFQPLVEGTVRRLLRAERREILKQTEAQVAKRGVQTLMAWLDDFYREHQPRALREFHPLFATLGESVGAAAAAEIGAKHDADKLIEFLAGAASVAAGAWISLSREKLKAVIATASESDDGDVLGAVTKQFDEWEESRPARTARRETKELGGAVARKVWKDNGITKMRWVTSGDTCPMCDRLDGKVVGIEQHFVGKGERWEAEGREPIETKSEITHPPLHKGCDCSILPG